MYQSSKPENGILETKSIPEYQLNSIYNYEKNYYFI